MLPGRRRSDVIFRERVFRHHEQVFSLFLSCKTASVAVFDRMTADLQFVLLRRKMNWKVLFLISFLDVTNRACGVSEMREKRNIESALYSGLEEICPFPCTCPSAGVCSECEECPRQLGEPCSPDVPCDIQKGYVCKYKHGDAEGICREAIEVPCVVYNKTYDHGETFNLDCRTQCACQNGTYGCSSLCPQEKISPRISCQHPRLVEIPGQCCREWMCDSQTAEQPEPCEATFSNWSPCSSECGSGLSTRTSNLNARCEPVKESRLCQTRRCIDEEWVKTNEKYHHLRKGHECKATHRISTAVFLRIGPCRSRKRYRPKYCGVCPTPGIVCQPSLSTTVKVDFICEVSEQTDDPSQLLPEYLEPGTDLWTDDFIDESDISEDGKLMSVLVQWILKCSCLPDIPETT